MRYDRLVLTSAPTHPTESKVLNPPAPTPLPIQDSGLRRGRRTWWSVVTGYWSLVTGHPGHPGHPAEDVPMH